MFLGLGRIALGVGTYKTGVITSFNAQGIFEAKICVKSRYVDLVFQICHGVKFHLKFHILTKGKMKSVHKGPSIWHVLPVVAPIEMTTGTSIGPFSKNSEKRLYTVQNVSMQITLCTVLCYIVWLRPFITRSCVLEKCASSASSIGRRIVAALRLVGGCQSPSTGCQRPPVTMRILQISTTIFSARCEGCGGELWLNTGMGTPESG